MFVMLGVVQQTTADQQLTQSRFKLIAICFRRL
jgi:hypothetical protein